AGLAAGSSGYRQSAVPLKWQSTAIMHRWRLMVMGSDSGLGLLTTHQNKRKSKKSSHLIWELFDKKNNSMTTVITTGAHSIVHAKKLYGSQEHQSIIRTDINIRF
ncbi:hypothetical protein, partial [Serratia marcescens]|uniref:hypothetical protein n=1 Tax=Serratia marcescens TaxID=615 RepID=UPI0013DA36D2